MITKLTIDRSKWACNTNNIIRNASSQMKDRDGFKCCLGFLAEACGIENNLGKSTPTNYTEEEIAKFPLNFRPVLVNNIMIRRWNCDLVEELVRANDGEPDNKTREKTVADYFKQAGITVKFTGEYLTR